jgi:carboxyl-terminal processing protease
VSLRIRALFLAPFLFIYIFAASGKPESDLLSLPAEELLAAGYTQQASNFYIEAKYEQENRIGSGLLPEPASSQPVVISSIRTELVSLQTPPLVEPEASSAVLVSAEEQALQKTVFKELWAAVSENYLYRDFNGLDWQQAHLDILDKIDAGLNMESFYQLLEDLVVGLNDEHSQFLRPEKVEAENARYAGTQGFVGIGVVLAPVPERDRAVILLTLPGGQAERVGLQARDSILAVDGEPILDEDGSLRSLLRGVEGSPVTVSVQTPGEEPREITLVRSKVSGPVPVTYLVIEVEGGKRIGYLMLISFLDSTIPAQVENALQVMTAAGPLDGLIIDNRFNEGGASTVLSGTLSLFSSGLLGHFVDRRSQKPLEVNGQDISGSQLTPLVVLIGEKTNSYGEVFSGILQDSGRAFLIGETSAGNVETLKGYNLQDGSRAWIAHSSFRPLNDPNQNWEETGVIPDRLVWSAWDLFSLSEDPAVISALEHLLEE